VGRRNRPGRWGAGAIYVRKDETGEIVHEGPDIDQVPAQVQLKIRADRNPRDDSDPFAA